MDRKIKWISGYYDEIDLVYEKAEGKPAIEKALSELEELALQEGRARCGMVNYTWGTLTPERYDALSGSDREGILYALGNLGLAKISTDFSPPTITVTLSPLSPLVLGCTMFSILNRLEKLDGSLNELFPNVTLLVQAPLGGKKGLFRCEMLIMQLYPWLSVTEASTNQIAVSEDELPTLAQQEHKMTAAAEKPGREKAPDKSDDKTIVVRNRDGSIREIHDTVNGMRVYCVRPEKKPGLFQRLFGKGKKQEEDDIDF